MSKARLYYTTDNEHGYLLHSLIACPVFASSSLWKVQRVQVNYHFLSLDVPVLLCSDVLSDKQNSTSEFDLFTVVLCKVLRISLSPGFESARWTFLSTVSFLKSFCSCILSTNRPPESKSILHRLSCNWSSPPISHNYTLILMGDMQSMIYEENSDKATHVQLLWVIFRWERTCCIAIIVLFDLSMGSTFPG